MVSRSSHNLIFRAICFIPSDLPAALCSQTPTRLKKQELEIFLTLCRVNRVQFPRVSVVLVPYLICPLGTFSNSSCSQMLAKCCSWVGFIYYFLPFLVEKRDQVEKILLLAVVSVDFVLYSTTFCIYKVCTKYHFALLRHCHRVFFSSFPESCTRLVMSLSWHSTLPVRPWAMMTPCWGSQAPPEGPEVLRQGDLELPRWETRSFAKALSRKRVAEGAADVSKRKCFQLLLQTWSFFATRWSAIEKKKLHIL